MPMEFAFWAWVVVVALLTIACTLLIRNELDPSDEASFGTWCISGFGGLFGGLFVGSTGGMALVTVLEAALKSIGIL